MFRHSVFAVAALQKLQESDAVATFCFREVAAIDQNPQKVTAEMNTKIAQNIINFGKGLRA